MTCKIRLQPTVADTVEFARRLEWSGCALLAVHGRQRGSERQRRDGPADLAAIKAVKAALKIPVLSNGNIFGPHDCTAALSLTGADGIMSVRGPGLQFGTPAAVATR